MREKPGGGSPEKAAKAQEKPGGSIRKGGKKHGERPQKGKGGGRVQRRRWADFLALPPKHGKGWFCVGFQTKGKIGLLVAVNLSWGPCGGHHGGIPVQQQHFEVVPQWNSRVDGFTSKQKSWLSFCLGPKRASKNRSWFTVGYVLWNSSTPNRNRFVSLRVLVVRVGQMEAFPK